MSKHDEKDWVLEGLKALGAGAVAPIMAGVAAATGDDKAFVEHAFRTITGEIDDALLDLDD